MVDKKSSKQPDVAVAPTPVHDQNQAYGQQSYDPNQQYQQQPQPMAQQPMQPVQYMMMERSLKGVGGWLIFFMICFGIIAIGYIWAFFAAMLDLTSAVSVLMLIFAPILAAGYITAIVLMSMEKKLGRLITWITLGVSALYTTINTIVVYAVSSSSNYYNYDYGYDYAYSRPSSALPLVIAAILVGLVMHGLIALYFWKSKRVQETLVK